MSWVSTLRTQHKGKSTFTTVAWPPAQNEFSHADSHLRALRSHYTNQTLLCVPVWVTQG